MLSLLILCAHSLSLALGTIPPSHVPVTNPSWPPTYDMERSTIAMPCNYSGWFDPVVAGSFGLVSFDWSNAKDLWANTKPMDAEERMVTQAAMVKGVSPDTHVWVYRNLVKALPWMRTVRSKLLDPAYAGFFLKFDPTPPLPNKSYHVPKCDTTYSPPICSEFYHDQEQTPQYGPHSEQYGSCKDRCDCGEGLPCGEYLWDHRNGSMLQKYLVDEYVLGPTGIGNPNISGVFLDDFWCYGSGCGDPVAGASEEDAHQQVDMGLTNSSIKDIAEGWRANMDAMQTRILNSGGFAWDLFPNQHNAGCGVGPAVTKDNCKATLRHECAPDKKGTLRSQPLFYGLQVGNMSSPDVDVRLPQKMENLASFLLVRGPYAWLGYGFLGCDEGLNYTLPKEFRKDYGSPSGTCREIKPGVFARNYTKTHVQVDCNTWSVAITPSVFSETALVV